MSVDGVAVPCRQLCGVGRADVSETRAGERERKRKRETVGGRNAPLVLMCFLSKLPQHFHWACRKFHYVWHGVHNLSGNMRSFACILRAAVLCRVWERERTKPHIKHPMDNKDVCLAGRWENNQWYYLRYSMHLNTNKPPCVYTSLLIRKLCDITYSLSLSHGICDCWRHSPLCNHKIYKPNSCLRNNSNVCVTMILDWILVVQCIVFWEGSKLRKYVTH